MQKWKQFFFAALRNAKTQEEQKELALELINLLAVWHLVSVDEVIEAACKEGNPLIDVDPVCQLRPEGSDFDDDISDSEDEYINRRRNTRRKKQQEESDVSNTSSY